MISKLKDTLLLVGDKNSDRGTLREIFSSAYNILEAEGAVQAAVLLEQNLPCVAAVLMDVPAGKAEEISTVTAAIRNM